VARNVKAVRHHFDVASGVEWQHGLRVLDACVAEAPAEASPDPIRGIAAPAHG
jgi:hypothetical protein